MNERRGETALITGASAGIGRALAEVFAENGFDLVVVARSEDALEELAERCRTEHGVEAAVLPLDLQQTEAPAQIVAAIAERGIEVDVLVNNAGLLDSGRFADIDLDAHARLVQLNVAALTALTHRFVGLMIARGRGRILNVSSITAFQPVPTLALYAASKAFVLSLSESLAEELKGTGVSVTALCPGLTKTSMFDRTAAVNAAARWVPDFLLSEVDDVARDGFDGCLAGETIVIPGLRNRFFTSLTQLSPRWLVRGVGGLVGRRAT
jgi:hypothetical protein